MDDICGSELEKLRNEGSIPNSKSSVNEEKRKYTDWTRNQNVINLISHNKKVHERKTVRVSVLGQKSMKILSEPEAEKLGNERMIPTTTSVHEEKNVRKTNFQSPSKKVHKGGPVKITMLGVPISEFKNNPENEKGNNSNQDENCDDETIEAADDPLDFHEETNKSNTDLQCMICSSNFSDFEELAEHVEEKHYNSS